MKMTYINFNQQINRSFSKKIEFSLHDLTSNTLDSAASNHENHRFVKFHIWIFLR